MEFKEIFEFEYMKTPNLNQRWSATHNKELFLNERLVQARYGEFVMPRAALFCKKINVIYMILSGFTPDKITTHEAWINQSVVQRN